MPIGVQQQTTNPYQLVKDLSVQKNVKDLENSDNSTIYLIDGQSTAQNYTIKFDGEYTVLGCLSKETKNIPNVLEATTT